MFLCYHHSSVPAILVHLFLSFVLLSFSFLPPSILFTSVCIHSFCVSVCILLHHLIPCFFTGIYLYSSSLSHFLFSCRFYPTLYPQTQSYLCALDISSRCLYLPECSPAPVSFSPVSILNNPFPFQFHQFSCWISRLSTQSTTFLVWTSSLLPSYPIFRKSNPSFTYLLQTHFFSCQLPRDVAMKGSSG